MTPPPHKPGGDGSAEEVSYSELFRRYLPLTLRWLRLYGVAERHRQDVAQEAWIRVYRNLESFDAERQFEPWLMTITFRAACDHLKRADVRRERLSDAGEVEPEAGERREDRRIDAARTLEALLLKLSPEHREVILMVDIEQMDPPEVAAALGVPVNTVYSRLARARDHFQRALDRCRASEERRLGALLVLPAFLCDWRALVESSRDLPPVSIGTEATIWEGIQRGLDALEGSPGAGTDGSPPAAPRSAAPPLGSPSPPPSLLALARLPWASPLGMAATGLIAGGLGGAALVWWLLGPATPSPVIAREVAPAVTFSSSAAPAMSASTHAAAAPAAPADAGAAAYDPREELSTLEAAWTLYLQGKCEAARAKLGKRTGRVHAKDYSDLRKKIEACLTGDGGTP